ncbi:hybrid sensor histidine kinase/response regulator [Pelagerythrobacter aerophilus]|uniref:histidine kinase n=1 Tax=Pelagerythrobacter aerophilus TaxID=2306995 RepID=A0A418NHQ9_9SPHN|nr:response regulator [Pelagerythrobacter aerophilus]RIV78120.1 response regulator [Pelagerythrobacter aerophilus]
MAGPIGQGQGRLSLATWIAAALVVSALLIWLATGDGMLTLGYAVGLAALMAAGYAFSRMRTGPGEAAFAPPDWSVTVAAIEQSDMAVALTDRANRLVCANRLYGDWFGIAHAPPNLDLDRPSLERLVRAAREAWRDGTSSVDLLEREDGSGSWRAETERAGRGDDYLVWRFTALTLEDPVARFAEWITGPFGAVLSNAGIETAIVGTDGTIRAASAGFAARATGDAAATLAGQEFVAQLRSDSRERIYFAREGQRGTPQMLIQVSLADPDAARPARADEAPSLMMLVESGIGIGGGWEGVGQAATPQLEALLGALPLGLAMTDRDGRFLFANEAFLRAAEIEREGLPSFPSDLVVREDKSALADAVRRFARGSIASADMAVRLRHQPDEPVSLGLAGVRGLGEAAVLLSLVDTTEETRLKRQVAQATKMQAVGQLAGGVAHDFNNVLTAIIGYCDLMLLRHTPGDSDYDDIQQIRANSNRAASLTRQLLAFSRQQTLRPEVLQLPDVVSEVSQLLKRLLGEKIAFKVHHDRDLGPVRADPQQLEQVIVNLAVNARDAMQARGDGTGRLTLATRRVTAADVRKMGSDIIPVADYTVLVVQDTGGGIPAELMGKIFEPFFTTKEQGKGTGLGLSTVYGIVKQSGGFIFCDNLVGVDGRPQGARFTIYLPVHGGGAPHEPRPAPDEPQATSEWSGGGRVLLVEDEDMVRAVAERALSRAGYSVTTAVDGEEGLAAIAEGGEFDLVLSDVVMPGMDGPAMVRAIRKVRPNLPVLFMSGYAEEQLRSEIDLADMHFIAKPFSVQEIGDKVAQVLGAVHR